MKPTDTEIRSVIMKMGADEVVIIHKDGSVYISFFRRGGCGRIHVNICNYLRKRFPGKEILVLESPRVNEWCQKARVRRVGTKHFLKASVKVTSSIVGG